MTFDKNDYNPSEVYHAPYIPMAGYTNDEPVDRLISRDRYDYATTTTQELSE